MASAHMLFSSGLVDGDTIIFHNEKGRLKAVKIAGYDEPHDSRDLLEEDEEDPEARIQAKVELGKGVVELDFPLNLVSQVEVSEAQVVSDALGGVETLWVGKTSMGDYLVQILTLFSLLQIKFNSISTTQFTLCQNLSHVPKFVNL